MTTCKLRRKVVLSVVAGSDHYRVLALLASLGGEVPADLDLRVVVILQPEHEALVTAVAGSSLRPVVLQNSASGGFASNHNSVMHLFSDADYFIISNDDITTSIETVGQLVTLLESAEYSSVGSASPRLIGVDGAMQQMVHGFPTARGVIAYLSGIHDLGRSSRQTLRRGGRDAARPATPRVGISMVETYTGAFSIVRGSCIREVGPMIDVSRVGCEETEWHYRMGEAGWECAVFNELSVVHVGGATVRKGRRRTFLADYYRGQLEFLLRHRRTSRYVAARAAGYVVGVLEWFIGWILRDDDVQANGKRVLLAARMRLLSPRVQRSCLGFD